VDGADLRAALDASCLRGALPPVDLPVMRMLADARRGGVMDLKRGKIADCDRATIEIKMCIRKDIAYEQFAWYEPFY